MKTSVWLWMGVCSGLSLTVLSGCLPPSGKFGQDQTLRWDKTRDSALRQDLDAYHNQLQSALETSADAIRDAAPKRQVRKMTALWKVRVNTMVSDAMAVKDPVTAMLETWAICLRVQAYFKNGDGASLFLDQQPRAVQTATQLTDGIEAVAAKFLSPDEVQATRERLVAYADSHPLTGTFEDKAAKPLSLDKAVWDGIAGIIGLPLMLPLAVPNAIQQSTKDVTTVADRWADIAEDMPRELRWQMELFMSNLDDYDAFAKSLETAQTISRSAERMSKVADDFNNNLTPKTREVVDPAEAHLATLIDHATWRAAELLVLAFVLASLLILLTRRRKHRVG